MNSSQSSPAKSNKSDAKTTIAEDTQKLTKDPNVRPSNPYDKTSDKIPKAMIETPDSKENNQTSLPISAPRFPPFSPPYSDTLMSPYSPQSP